jgi:hypothetical protein
MQVGWLLEREMFPDYQDVLVAQIKEQGHCVKFVPERGWGYTWDDLGSSYLKVFPAGSCVVFHGSIEMATRLTEMCPWRPAVYCNWTNFECSTYYCHFGQYLLNDDYVMLPFGELRRRREFLFESFGRDGAIFVRPNSCRKSFTGQLAHGDTFDKDVEFMAFYDVPPETIVVVSSPKEISREWRFLVAAGRVVACSLYKTGGKLAKRADVESAAQALANELAAGDFQPDRAWVLDICETAAGDFRLLEIGSFSCAELYACDLAAVVSAISILALEDWAGENPEANQT